ncbi:hypothetical protein E8E14_005037 [Neopestalotiopsis sp. 37M]|nr:hypothetical protein E8E14_005037 [Neopestalotiopsis sp. 37M]
MPKVDATRNYYADLQVTPASSADDVKKQYRKLAMQWHPDRNRGKEEEASKKFQIIQAAFEILTDPTLKRQYDEARSKSAGRFPTSSGVRGNPWANAGSDFPPPPKRTGANTAGAGTQPRPTPGASRYSNWGQSSGADSRKSSSQKPDAGSAKAHYDAWRNMRSNANANTPRKPPPTPGRPPTSSARDSKASDSEGIPRTASQKQKAQASFGNTARRTGFTPRSPGLGDEPPVSNNNYFTTRKSTNIFPDEPAQTTSQSRRTSAVPDPLAQFRDMDGRHSSPYATPGGEKTSLFGDGLNRARSTRDSSRPSTSNNADTSFPFPRQRSSSTPRSSSNDGSSEDSTKVNTGAKVNPTTNSTSTSHRSGPSDRYRPKSAESAHTSSQSAANKSRTDGTANQPSENSTKYATSPPMAPATQNRFKTNVPSAKFQRATAHPSTTRSRLSSTLSGVKRSTSGLLPFEQYLKSHVDRLIRSKEEPASDGVLNDAGFSEEKRVEFATVPTYHFQGSTNGLNSFGYTHNSAHTSPTFGRKSTDNISTQFVDEQPEAFSFTAGGPPGEDNPPPLPTKRGSQSSSRLGRRGSPMKINRRPVPPAPGLGPSPMRPDTSASDEGASTKFSAAEWGEKIGSEHFVPKPSSASTSPTRRTNSRRGSKPVKVTRGGSAGIIDDDDEIPTATAGWTDTAPNLPPRTQSPMAMDIDEPSVEKEAEVGEEDLTEDGARKIPVEPTRPEWRAGNVDVKGKEQEHRPTLSTDATNTAATQTKSAPASAQPFVAQNGGSEDSEEFRATFADFKKVEPFTDPQPTGLNSFNDLKTTLPFESQASGQVPLAKPQVAPALDFPAVPVAPRLPPTMAVPGLRPSNTQWRKYSQDFYNYMEKWETFNEMILTHFATRQFEMQKRRGQFGRAWLEGVQGEDGAATYQAELQQDHEIRKQWIRCCDDHQARVREFVTFRDRAK